MTTAVIVIGLAAIAITWFIKAQERREQRKQH